MMPQHTTALAACRATDTHGILWLMMMMMIDDDDDDDDDDDAYPHISLYKSIEQHTYPKHPPSDDDNQ